MSSQPLESADVKEDRVDKMSELSSILPTPVESQSEGSSGTISNLDVGARNEKVSEQDIDRLTDPLENLASVDHTLTGRSEVVRISGLSVVQLLDQADTAQAKYGRLKNLKDLDEAIECRCQILSLTPDTHHERPRRLGALWAAFLQRYCCVGKIDDLNKTIEYLTQTIRLTSDGHADKPSWLNDLGNLHEWRFRSLDEQADLDWCIEYKTQAVLFTPEEATHKPSRLNDLGRVYEMRFRRLGGLVDLNKAIEHRTQAVLGTPDGHAEKPHWLHDLGCSYASRFERLEELADLNKGIEYKAQALLLTPNGHPNKPCWLNDIGSLYDRRFGRFGEVGDMNQAIHYHTQAVLTTPKGHAHKPSHLDNLGGSYETRFRRLGRLPDLDEAIEYRTQAVLSTPDGHPDKPCWLNNLGKSYESRFGQLGKLSDLDKAIEYQTQAVLPTPDGLAHKPGHLNNLGLSYWSRFGRLGKLTDLNQAIKYTTEAVQLTADGDADKATWLNNLGNSYQSRFLRLGELADLNKGIDYQAQALLLTPDGHGDKPCRLHNLGSSYESRFGRLGELADLDKAIDYHTQAVLTTPDGHPDKSKHLTGLGITYWSRFRRLGELIDLNKAIEHKTQALLLAPDLHPEKPAWLNNLGNSYRSRFLKLSKLADLNKAIDYHTQAVLTTPGGHADNPVLLNNLGISYDTRSGRSGELADLKEAIKYKTQAMQLTPDGHARKPIYLNSLGDSYEHRFQRFGDLSSLELAQLYFQRGAQLTVTHPQSQSRCARGWARCAMMLGTSPRLAYERGMELIPYLVWLGTTINQRYTLLSEIHDLATEAAAWAISGQAFHLALEWLEEGRSIVWNQILQLRTPFDDLASADPLLAQELKYTAKKLESAGSRQVATPLSTHQYNDLEKEAQEHHNLASKWEQLLGDARQIPGFQNFLRPRKTAELLLAATDGPIVVLNAHSTRCDALIISPECDDIAHLHLSNFSLSKMGETCVQLDSLVGYRGDMSRGLKLLRPASKPESVFKGVLATLWSDVVQPVLDILVSPHTVSTDELPHVTWCTTGELSFLPLHAAGLYDGSHLGAFDLVVSSYTPTLNALLSPSAPLPNIDSDIGVLAIGQEHTRGLRSLPNTIHELAAIKTRANAIRFQQLDGENGTVSEVLDAMSEYNWVHLACHATQNPFNPAHSAFHLHDGDLTLEAITTRAFKNKGLAFLSACQTATGDRKLPDEAVHLAAGMLMAGYPSVIATMWSIYDEDAPEVAGEVYAQLLEDGQVDHRKAARALHRAVAGLRERVGHKAFKRWVPFVHMGM